MNNDLKSRILSDEYRHYEGGGKPWFWKKRNVSLHFTITHRKAHFYSQQNGIINKIKSNYYRYCLNRLSRQYLFQIPYTVEFGYGLNIVHFGRIIIAPSVIIGDNCNIFTGVTIGSCTRGNKKGVPTIKNNVWIGPNSVIVGKITIGNNVLIAGNSYVNFDVPDNSIVIGNPGVILYKENATDGYICQKYVFQ